MIALELSQMKNIKMKNLYNKDATTITSNSKVQQKTCTSCEKLFWIHRKWTNLKSKTNKDFNRWPSKRNVVSKGNHDGMGKTQEACKT